MKVMMLVSQAGPEVSRVAGQEYDVPGDEAKRMIDKGIAEPVKAKRGNAAAKPERNAMSE